MKIARIFAVTTLLATIIGCESQDARLASLAEQATYELAAQNKAVVHLTEQVASDHRRVVEATEQSRQELLALDQEVRRERTALDLERQAIARTRMYESRLSPAIRSLGLLIVAALPLIVCVHLLRGVSGSADDAAAEMFLRELTRSDSLLRLPAPETTGATTAQPEKRRIEHNESPGKRTEEL
jgi:hypothetical protein